jgi:uncharacterized repeat protein (TIGR01451 family)
MKKVIFLIIGFLLMGVINAEAGGLELIKEVFQEVEVKGPDGKIEKKMVPADMVVPGTEIFYVITYRNKGEKAEKVVITNPIPKELDYISASEEKSGADIHVSVDEGKVYNKLERLDIKGPDGKVRSAQAADVTHVRWTLPSSVGMGQEGKVSFKARLK